MDIEEINKKIQAENERHKRVIDKLQDDKNKENEHHAREIEYLKSQIDIIQPKIILLCGNVAVQSILGNVGGITKIRGKWFDGGENVHGAKLMPIFHPSYLLRNDSREKGSPKWLMWQDIQEIKKEYDKL